MKNLIIKNTRIKKEGGITSFDGILIYNQNKHSFKYIPERNLLLMENDFNIPFEDYKFLSSTIKNYAEYSFCNIEN